MTFSLPWGGRFRLGTYVTRAEDALAPAALAAIRESIVGSDLLGDNTLTSQFSGTYGFSVAFRREALPEVVARFPAFAPFLEAAVWPECDAFLLNPLLIQAGREVAPHVDQSLESYARGIGCPACVSVLYVQVPPGMRGGELTLSHRGTEVAALPPREGALTVFRGDLVHRVTPVVAAPGEPAPMRISLVLEQYRVPPPFRAAVPRFDLRSRAGTPA